MNGGHRQLLAQTEDYLKNLYADDPKTEEVRNPSADLVLRDEVQEAIEQTQREIQALLRKIDPAWARGNLSAIESMPLPNLRFVGLGRFVWALLAGADGAVQSPSLLEEYADSCDVWMGLYMAGDLLASMHNPAHDRTGSMEAIRRLAITQTRFLWISRTIVECGIRAWNAEGSGAIEEDLIGPFYRLLRRYGNDSALIFGSSTPPAFQLNGSNFGTKLLDRAAVSMGSYRGRSFRNTILGRDPELRPFIKVGEEYFPAEIRSALMALELALFEMISLEGGPKGHVFEETVRAAIMEVAPDGLEVIPSDAVIEPGLPGNPLQTDLVLVAGDAAIVGEVKCYAPSKYPDGSAFGAPMAEAIAQAALRVDNFVPGSALVASGRRLDRKTVNHVHGLVVPSYAVGQGPWDPEAIRASRPDFSVSVVPLHQLLLVLSLLESAEELYRYLDLRSRLMKVGTIAYDEHEYLRIFLLNGRRAPERVLKEMVGPEVDRIQLVNYAFPFQKCINKDKPRQRLLWQRYFLDNGERIDPFGPKDTKLVTFDAKGGHRLQGVARGLPLDWGLGGRDPG